MVAIFEAIGIGVIVLLFAVLFNVAFSLFTCIRNFIVTLFCSWEYCCGEEPINPV